MLLLSGEKMAMQVALEKADAAAKKMFEDHKAEEISLKLQSNKRPSAKN